VVGGITHQGQGSPAPLAPPGHVLALARVLRLFSRGLGKSVTSEQVFGPAASHWREGGATSDPRSERLAAYAVSRTHGGYMHGKRDGTFSR
jgi:hypothetical protein